MPLDGGNVAFTGPDGAPVAGGKLYTYQPGTTTAKATYSNAAGSVANTNPVVLDAYGKATVFWSGIYKVVLTDADDVVLWSVDQVSTLPLVVGLWDAERKQYIDGADKQLSDRIETVNSRVDGAYGYAEQVAAGVSGGYGAFQASGTGAVTRTFQSKMRDALSPMDFGAVGDGVTDDWSAVQAAINAAAGSVLTPGVVSGNGRTFAISKQIIVSGSQDVTLDDIKLKAITGTWTDTSGTATATSIAEAGAMLVLTRPTSDATSRSRLSRITLNCNEIAKSGVLVKSAGAGSTLAFVRALYFSDYGLWIKGKGSGNGDGSGNNDVKLVSCSAAETTAGTSLSSTLIAKQSTYSARTGIGCLLDGSADVEFTGCSFTMCKNALVVRNLWNASFSGCKFWNGPVRSDASSVTVLIEATANRVQFTGCRFDDGAVKLYGFNHQFAGCAFIQFTTGLVQLVATAAGETASKLTMVGNTIENGTVQLLTEGSGTWAGVQCEFLGNRRSNGADVTIQGCTAVTGVMRLQSDGQLQIGNSTNAATVSASSITPSIAAHGVDSKASLGAGRWSADASGPILDGLKSRGASVGAYVPVLTGDTLFTMAFSGAYSTTSGDAGRGATLRAVATGDWSAGSRKCKLILATTSTTAPADRLELDEVGVRALVPVQMPSYTVSTLPAASTCQYGRAFVTDATGTTFNATPTGGGANKAPVWSDGAAWRIG